MYENDYAASSAFPAWVIVLWIGIALLMIISLWKIFEKAGQPGWAAIIPLYNAYIILKIVGKPGWWLILFLIPIVNYIFIIWTYNLLSKSFGKDVGFTIGLVLLGVIFFPILAFGDAKYQGPSAAPSIGTLDEPTRA